MLPRGISVEVKQVLPALTLQPPAVRGRSPRPPEQTRREERGAVTTGSAGWPVAAAADSPAGRAHGGRQRKIFAVIARQIGIACRCPALFWRRRPESLAPA